MAYKKVIHIGANKTASTTLQRALFSQSHDLIYLGEDCPGYETYRENFDSMVNDDDFFYSGNTIENLFEKHDREAKDKNVPFLYSNEDIMTSRVPSQVYSRITRLMNDAKVLLVIRNQFSALHSWYANHGAFLKNVPRRFWKDYVTVDEFMQHCLDFYNYSPLASYKYYNILAPYINFYGKENVHVLLFEDFVQNKEKFMKELCSLLELNVDKSISLLEGRSERKRLTQRRFNLHKLSRKVRLLKDLKLPKQIDAIIDSGDKANNFGFEKWGPQVQQLYSEDNKKLAEEFNIDLERFKYPL